VVKARYVAAFRYVLAYIRTRWKLPLRNPSLTPLGAIEGSTNTAIVLSVTKAKSISIRIRHNASQPARGTRPGTATVTQAAAKLAQRDGLVLEHLPLVKAIAINIHQKLPVHVDLDDLVQAGVIGLLDAANKFDTNRQDVFSLYAKHRIRGAILDSLRQLDWASRDTRRKQKQLEAARHDLASTLQRAPTAEEVAERLGLDRNQWHAMMLDLENTGPISADSRPSQSDDLPQLDAPGKPETRPDFMCVHSELRSALGDAIKTLTERYRKVLLLYYAKDLSMREIGAILGINESRVSQIHKKALEKLALVLQHNGIASIHAFQ
jgi:RNA polymerase sigma factor for flagellar operon FliA